MLKLFTVCRVCDTHQAKASDSILEVVDSAPLLLLLLLLLQDDLLRPPAAAAVLVMNGRLLLLTMALDVVAVPHRGGKIWKGKRVTCNLLKFFPKKMTESCEHKIKSILLCADGARHPKRFVRLK